MLIFWRVTFNNYLISQSSLFLGLSCIQVGELAPGKMQGSDPKPLGNAGLDPK